MTDNTQSLIDRMAEALRYSIGIDWKWQNMQKCWALIEEYEAHKASQGDAVPAREATVWQYRDIIYGDEALWWEECSKSDYEELSLEPDVYETRALGVIDPIQPGSTTS